MLVALWSPAVAAPGGGSGSGSGSSKTAEPSDSAEAIKWKGKLRVRARLVADKQTVKAGGALRVGLLFSLDKGWHIYWTNSGQSGLPTKIVYKAKQLQIGAARWPGPHVESEGEGEDAVTTYGWSEEVLLARRARVAAEAKGEAITLRAKATFLACETTCIPGTIEVVKRIALGDAPVASKAAPIFDRYDVLVPRAAAADGLRVDAVHSTSAVRPDDTFSSVFAVSCSKAKAADCPVLDAPKTAWHAFVPDKIDNIELKKVRVGPHPSKPGLIVRLELSAGPDDPNKHQTLSGVLQLRGKGGVRYYRVAAPLPRARKGAKVAPTKHALLDAPVGLAAKTRSAGSGSGSGAGSAAVGAVKGGVGKGGGAAKKAPVVPKVGLLEALLFALIGGMLLNLMPCVFPVLALKVYSITTMAHHGRRHIAQHGLAYAGGVLISMLVLGGIVLGLRAAGSLVGWGFQFQSPMFIAVLAALLVAFAVNLFGVFEIGMSASRLGAATDQATGFRRSFGEGALAVVLATPCSAPFLGSAVGFAFAAPATTALSVFAVMGVGLALPFVAVSLAPGLSKLLPRPGAWMVRMKQVLGFALLGTVVWLTWILGQTQGVDGVVQLLAFLAVVGFACWIYGINQMKTTRRALVSLVAALGIIVSSGSYLLRFVDPAAAGGAGGGAAKLAGKGPIKWRAFDKKALAATLKAGKSAFVDFTADWCITCKWNERTVLRGEKVLSALKTCGFEMFKADWTRRDETIRKELARFGKAGVPLYLVYSPRTPDRPQVLPEIITQKLVLAALKRAQPKEKATCVK
ncbi:MAG: thioredoxin family protein [Myxococcales bacterium]|nr:thioredoxin family protein [Myxococcales bacterium]